MTQTHARKVLNALECLVHGKCLSAAAGKSQRLLRAFYVSGPVQSAPHITSSNPPTSL